MNLNYWQATRIPAKAIELKLKLEMFIKIFIIKTFMLLTLMSYAQDESHSIRVLQSHWPTHMHADPTGEILVGDWIMFRNLYSNLVELATSQAVKPALAERWTQSADGKRWVFTLRKKLNWSDGTRITAEQIVFSFRRAMRGTKHTKFSAYVESMRALNELEIEFILKKAPKNFLILLAFVDSSILHPDAYKNKQFTWDAPNSGPFRVTSHSENKIELKANPYNWDYAKEKPQHAFLMRTQSGSPEERIATLLNSSWDASSIDAGVIQDQKQVQELKKKYDVFVSNPEFLFCAYFSKKRTKEGRLTEEFRRYLLQAIYNRFWDRDKNNPLRASGMRFHVLKGSLSFAQFDEVFSKLAKGVSQDKSKFSKTLEILTSKRTSDKPVVKYLFQVIRELGFTIKEITLESNEQEKRYQSGNFDIALYFSGATEDDPDTAWRYYNNDFAVPAATDQELDQAQLESDQTKRNQMYQEFEKRAIERALFIPLKYEPTYIVTSKRVVLNTQLATDWGLQLFKLRMR